MGPEPQILGGKGPDEDNLQGGEGMQITLEIREKKRREMETELGRDGEKVWQ